MANTFTKHLIKVCLFIISIMFLNSTNAQISLTSTSGSITSASYSTLKSAFDSINSGAHQGVISLTINGTSTETVSAVLNASGVGAANYTAVTLTPTGGAASTITGSIAGPLIDLNGADNFKINGLNTGGNSLTINNTSATSTAATIRFINDASSDTIQNCTIIGASTGLGTVTLSTGTTTGNDNNVILSNVITAGAAFPINGIYSLGTSAIIDNSGNAVIGNNISDYFSATAASNGMNINSNNSNWVINNNKFFQTATRTYTTANTHTAINVLSGVGYTITGNTVGYANSTGTGTTNMVGNSVALAGFPSSYTVSGTANATRFIGINCTFTAGGTVSTIQGNTIAGFALYTSSGATTTIGILCGIAVNSGNANIGTVAGNTIGSSTGNGSIYTVCTTTGGVVVGVYATSANTVNIQNNTVGAIDAMGSTATICGAVTGINSAGTGVFNISGNIIGNTTSSNLRMGNLLSGTNLSNIGTTFSAASGTATFRGILNSSSGAVTIGSSLLPNIVQNAVLSSTGTSVAFRGIELTSGVYLVSNNIVRNISSASANTTVSTALLAGVGILSQGGTVGSVITKNSIYNLSLTNTTTTGTNLAGVAVSNTAIDIIANTIYGFSNASTSTTLTTPGTASGIMLRSATASSNVNIINNMISLGNGQTTNTSFIGIWGNHGSSPNPNVNIYNNSISIEGSVSSGGISSFGYLRGNFATTAVNQVVVNIKNNIFSNTRSGGTGGHYAIANYFNATTTSATGWAAGASNYNILNANSATVGFWSTNQTLAGWRTASAGDANSITNATITFSNSLLGDLHINMGATPNQMESGGLIISGINNDIDGDIRQGSVGYSGTGSAPDLGADEFNGVQLDLNPPTIAISTLGNSPVTLNRIVTATITDPSVVKISTDGPKLYYKKTSDNNVLVGNTSADNGWKYVSATNVGSLFTFNVDYSILNGGFVAPNDTIQYFIVAMDSSPNNNVAISNGTLALATTSTTLGASNFPIAGLTTFYRIVGNLSGVVTVGVGGTYSSFTNVGGLFDDMNNKYINGNITAQVISDISTELGTVGLLEFNNAYQLSIIPDAPVLRTISTTSTILVGLLGADNVTIDGRFGGSGKYLLFQNNNATTTSIPLLISNQASTSNGCQNINIKNTLFEGGSTNLSGGTLVNNIHIQNNGHRKIYIDSCEFKKSYNGIVVGAGTVTVNYDSLFFTNNIFGEDLSTKYLTFSGIQLFYASNSVVKNNVFKNLTTNLALNNSAIIQNTGCLNVIIEQNRIFGNRSTNTGLYGTYGISILAGTNTIIRNNAIYNLNSSSWNLTSTTDQLFAIRLAGATGVKIYNNSISLDSISFNTGAAQNTACIANFGATGVEIVNNILRNTQVGFSGSKAYALYLSSGTVTNASNNVLYTAGPNAVLSLVGTTDYTTLSALQTATSLHANSFTVNPNYTDTNSNLTPLSCIVNNSGVTLSDVTNDLNGTARGLSPDIGAFEFTPTPIALPTVTSPINYCKNSTASNLSATGSNTLLWYVSAAGGAGSTTAPTPVTTTSGITNFYVADSNQTLGCISPRAQVVVNVNDTIYNNNITSLSQTVCSSSTLSAIIASTPTGGNGSTYSYQWISSTLSSTAGFVVTAGTSNTQNYTPSGLTSDTWFRRIVSSGACNTDTSAAILFTINNPVANNSITTLPQTICSGTAPSAIIANAATGGDGTTYNYTWLSSTTSATSGFSAIASSNTQNYTPSSLTANTWFRRRVASGLCNADTSAAIQISVNPVIANNTATGAQTICSGNTPTSITGSTPTGGNATYTYTWLRSTTSATAGFSVASGTNNLISYASGSLTSTTWFRRLVVSGSCSDTSVAVTVTVNPVLASNTATGTQTICSGTIPSAFVGSAPTGGSGIYTYLWQRSTTSATAGFTSAVGTNNLINYTSAALTATSYFRRVLSSGGCVDTSAAITVTVNPTIAGNTSGAAQSVCPGSSISLTGGTVSGGNSTYTYQWQQSTTGASTGFSNASGTATNSNYTTSAILVNTWFRRVVNSGSCVDSSAAVAISAVTPLTNNTVGSSQTICSGSVPSSLIGSLPTGGLPTNLTKISEDFNGGVFPLGWSLTNTSSLLVFSSSVNSFGRSAPTGAFYSNNYSVSSGTAQIASTIFGATTSKDSLRFDVAARGYDPTYFDSVFIFVNTGSGFNTKIASWLIGQTPDIATGGITTLTASTSGYTSPASTDWFTKVVALPVGTIQVRFDLKSGFGNNVFIDRIRVDSSASYNYVWQSSTTSSTAGFTNIASANTQNFSPGVLTQNTWYRRVVNAICNDTSSTVGITVTNPIANNTASSAQTICSGSAPVALTGSVPTGGNGTFTYQWLVSSTSATSGFTLASGTNNTQNYTPSTLTQNTWFRRRVVSGACADDTTAAIQITINNAVATNTITGIPQTICSGSTPAQITASVATGGNGSTYTYGWLASTSSAASGFSAASGTNNTQNYTPSALTQTTWFRRRVISGVCNADTTAAIQITINNAIATNTITGTPQTICSGSTPAAITASVATGGDGSTYAYSWLSSTTSANAGFSAIASSNTQNYTPGALTQNTWFRRRVLSGVCNADTSTAILVSITNTNTWTGATSTAWEIATNWGCGRVPTLTDSVVIVPTTNQPIVIDGNRFINHLAINSGATLTINNTNAQLGIAGTFTKVGTLNHTNGYIGFLGTTAVQTIPANTYARVYIGNPFGVQLAGNITVTDTLNFNSGPLLLGNNNLTMSGSNSVFFRDSATRHIVTNGTGTVNIANIGASGRTSAVRFPVGINATSFTPITITNAGTQDQFSVRVINGVNSNGLTGTAVTSNAVNRTWAVNELVNGGSNATVTVQWNAADELSGFARANSYVAFYNGTTWMSTVASAATGSNPYTQTRSGITSFSAFGVGSGGTLPVELISFNGKRISEKVQLNWATASEINNDYFVIERSAHNKMFEAIGDRVKGAGNSNVVNQYQIFDNEALGFATQNDVKTIYYRLRQVDFDGTINYSKVISVSMNQETTAFDASVYPNPFNGTINVTVSTNNTANTHIEVVDINGKTVYSETLGTLSGNSIYTITNLDKIPAGMYFIKVVQETDSKVVKVYKINN